MAKIDKAEIERRKRLVNKAKIEKQKKYWLRRAQSRIGATDREIETVKAEQEKAYKVARETIRREIDSFYRAFSTDAGITEDEARRLLSRSELKSFHDELESKRLVIKKLIANDPENERLKKYDEEWEKLSKVRELTRKEALEANVQTEIVKLGAKQQSSMQNHVDSVLKTNMEMTADDIDKVLKTESKLGVGSIEQVERAARENWQYSDFSGRIWEDKDKLITETRDVIENGFAHHKGAIDMAADLSTRLNASKANALRVVRTEFNHLANTASIEEYRSKGIKKYRFVAAIDNRTCDWCHELNGKEFFVKDAKIGVNFPPIHPNCRSTTVAVIDWNDEDLWDFSEITLDDDEIAELGLSEEDGDEIEESNNDDSANNDNEILSEFNNARHTAESDADILIKEGKLTEFNKKSYVNASMHQILNVNDYGVIGDDAFDDIAKKDVRSACITALFEIERIEISKMQRDIERWKDNERVQKRWAKEDARYEKYKKYLEEHGINIEQTNDDDAKEETTGNNKDSGKGNNIRRWLPIYACRK